MCAGAIAFALALKLAHSHSLACALARVLAHALARAIARADARSVERAVVRAREYIFLFKMVNNFRFATARARIQQGRIHGHMSQIIVSAC